MSEELKSCPFCGCDEPMVMEHTSLDWVIHCKKCHAKTGRHHTLHGAIYSWNSRHESDELPEWVRKAIETRIEKSREKQDKITRVGPSIEREFWYNRIEALKWVLSLRMGEE